MKKVLSAVAFAALLAATACSRGETQSSEAAPPPTPPAATNPAPAQQPSSQQTASMPAMAGMHDNDRGAPETAAPDAPILTTRQLYNPASADVYLMASQVPDRLDQLYCYCHCHQHMKHRSLRTCFQTHHAEECNVCQHEAVMAYNDWKAGKTVAETQKAADIAFNGGMPPPSI